MLPRSPLCLLVLAFPAVAVAQTGTTPAPAAVPATKPAAPPPKRTIIRFTGDLGYVSTSGNSSVQTLNLGDKLSAKTGSVTVSQQFSVVNGRSKGSTVTSLYRGSLRIDVALERTIAVYSSMNFERNVFSGLRSRVASVTGLSALLISDDRHKLVVEGGLSLNRQRSVDTTKRPDVDFLGGRAATAYTHRFSAKASFAQTVEFLPNFHEGEDLRINTESAVVAPITKDVGVKLSYVIRYDGLPQNGFQATDRLFTSGIQISL